MAKTQTRMRSSERRSIVLAHTANIKPGIREHSSEVSVDELRRKGNRVASRMTAILARRASFHVGS